jgi:hypothetical protein
MFVSLNFSWPTELQSMFAAMSVFNFNIQIAAPEVRFGRVLVLGRRLVCTVRAADTFRSIGAQCAPRMVSF